MKSTVKVKSRKTFPLEIEPDLHKELKHKAIELDMTLHAYIIQTLAMRVQEEVSDYKTSARAAKDKDSM